MSEFEQQQLLQLCADLDLLPPPYRPGFEKGRMTHAVVFTADSRFDLTKTGTIVLLGKIVKIE
jgi:hypothetical protein